MMIFGYGSLLAVEFINSRKMKRIYREEDLVECNLMGYKRGWNAFCDGWRYLGVVESPDAKVNGVIFPLDLTDLDAFKESEGFNYEDSVYDLIDVTDKIDMKLPVGERVFTCVTVNPQDDNGFVAPYYMGIILECLRVRGWDFTNDFMELTEENKKKER